MVGEADRADRAARAAAALAKATSRTAFLRIIRSSRAVTWLSATAAGNPEPPSLLFVAVAVAVEVIADEAAEADAVLVLPAIAVAVLSLPAAAEACAAIRRSVHLFRSMPFGRTLALKDVGLRHTGHFCHLLNLLPLLSHSTMHVAHTLWGHWWEKRGSRDVRLSCSVEKQETS